MSHIGQLEILRLRVYPLDAESHDPTRSTVVVQPGTYEVHSDGLSTYWMLHGALNRRGPWRMGDGMFSMQGNDEPSEIQVVFPSRRFGTDEWAELITGPEFAEGPDQRLRLSLFDGGAS